MNIFFLVLFYHHTMVFPPELADGSRMVVDHVFFLYLSPALWKWVINYMALRYIECCAITMG